MQLCIFVLTQRRYYKKVPALQEDDNVLPPAREIPSMLSNTRKRTISVGPQSEADVREFIANREQRRRNSRSETSPSRRPTRKVLNSGTQMLSPAIGEVAVATPLAEEPDDYLNSQPAPVGNHKASLQVNLGNTSLLTPPLSRATSNDSGREDEQQDQRMFSALEKPRIRYDVEVITKLVVYAGIAWLAIEGNPILFQNIGLV